MSFAGAGLALGDRFYVTVTAAEDGHARTLLLGHNIPEAVADGPRCDVTLYIRKPTLEVTRRTARASPR
jgi:hypothetical protein